MGDTENMKLDSFISSGQLSDFNTHVFTLTVKAKYGNAHKAS